MDYENGADGSDLCTQSAGLCHPKSEKNKTLFITKVPSDFWPLYFWHFTKRELAGVGDVASDRQPGLCLYTVLFTHFLTHARDCAFRSCRGSTRCDKSQGCSLPVTLSCEHGKHWSLFPLSELCLFVFHRSPKCVLTAPENLPNSSVSFFSPGVKPPSLREHNRMLSSMRNNFAFPYVPWHWHISIVADWRWETQFILREENQMLQLTPLLVILRLWKWSDHFH